MTARRSLCDRPARLHVQDALSINAAPASPSLRDAAALQAKGSSYHYKGKRSEPVALKRRIKEIAEARVRYGYRRITALLKRKGWPVNGKRICSAAQQDAETTVKAKLTEDRQAAARVNKIWAIDFLHDQLFDGRKIRILAVIDLFSRFFPALDPQRARVRLARPDVGFSPPSTSTQSCD